MSDATPGSRRPRELATAVREERFQLRTLPRPVAFWVAAAIVFLAFAANTAASPL